MGEWGLAALSAIRDGNAGHHWQQTSDLVSIKPRDSILAQARSRTSVWIRRSGARVFVCVSRGMKRAALHLRRAVETLERSADQDRGWIHLFDMWGNPRGPTHALSAGGSRDLAPEP